MTLWKSNKIKVINLTETGVVGKKTEFDVDASRAGRGSLEIEINGGSVACTILPQGNGQYHASFTPLEAKQHVIQLKFNGHNLPKNPFKVDIRPGDSVTVSGPGLMRVPVNQPTSFTVRSANRRQIAVSASITSPSGSHVENCTIDNGDGGCLVQYIPAQAGTYVIEVFCAGGAYSGNPLSSEAFDVSAVTVRTVFSYAVGEPFGFQIDTSRAGAGALEVTILSENNRMEDNCVIPHTVTQLLKGLYHVKFTPSTPNPTYASILFNSTELSQSPVRLDSHSPTLHVHPGHSISAESRADSEPRMQHPRPGNSTTSGSSRDGSIPGDISDDNDYIYVDMSQNLHISDPWSTGTAASPVSLEDDNWSNGKYKAHPNKETDVKRNALAVFEALHGCINKGRENVCIVRHPGLVNDLLELYKDEDVASKTLFVEIPGEPGTGSDRLMRELFRTFWIQVSKDLLRGEERLVPNLPAETMRKESWKFVRIGRILSHTVALTGAIPSMLARSTLIKLISDADVEDECLLEDFLFFVTTRERTLLTKAMSDFRSLTDGEYDRLRNLYRAHGFQCIPRQTEIKEQVLTIAYQDLVVTPGPLISKMRQGIPESHNTAFWQRLSADDITHILQVQRPTPEKVASVIASSKEDMTYDEDRTLYFLQEFVASLDFDTLTDFLIFVTGSAHQPDKISVTFTTLTGLDGKCIRLTSSNHLEIPSTYSSFRQFKQEFNSALTSA